MDTIASMRAFVAVAKTGSFSAAAQKLDLVPSVITKRVTQLERIVGKTLFHRSTRKVVLSADGEHHLERIIAAIAAHDQALSELRKGVRRLTGPIKIKVPSTLGFLRLNALVREFAELHPDVDVEVLLLDGPMNPAAEGSTSPSRRFRRVSTMCRTNFYGRCVEVSLRAGNICRRIRGSTTRANSRSTAAWSTNPPARVGRSSAATAR